MKKDEDERWVLFEGKQKHFEFHGRLQYFFNLPSTAQPVDFCLSYLDSDIIGLMVTETNRNATQVLSEIRLNRSSRLRKWRPTNPKEMKSF